MVIYSATLEVGFMNDIIIEASHLSVKIGHRYILKDVNWSVRKGERWVVFGMNGCGKTTLLSIIAGFQFQTKGNLAVFGEFYNNENILAFRKKIGWVSASFYDKVYTKESVLDVVLSGKFGTLGLRGGIEDEDIRLVKQLLEELSLSDKLNRPFATLSKGERQNVLIARAMFSKPEVLILDEPCTGLDLYNREHLFATMRDLAQKSNITIIYVTHYVDEVLDIFDHALFLRQGMVINSGSVETMFTSENLTKLLDYPVVMDISDRSHFQANLQVKSNICSILQEVKIS